MCTKDVVLTMPNNICRIFEYCEAPISTFTINHWPKNYNWTLLDVPETPTKEELRNANLIPHPKMPKMLDER